MAPRHNIRNDSSQVSIDANRKCMPCRREQHATNIIWFYRIQCYILFDRYTGTEESKYFFSFTNYHQVTSFTEVTRHKILIPRFYDIEQNW